MKKILSFSLWCLLALWLVSSVFAQNSDILSYLNELSDWSEEFWYSSDDSVTISMISDSEVVIESSLIENILWDPVDSYMVLYSTSKNAYENSNYSEKYYTWVSASNWKISLTLNVNDARIDRGRIYYVTILPIDQNVSKASWMPSSTIGELCFKIDGRVYWKDDDCESHSSDNRIYTLTWVSHVCKDRKMTLTWNNTFVNDNVDIFLWDDDNENFVRLTTVSKNDNKYTFDLPSYLTSDGDKMVKFKPNDGWMEINYTAHCLTSQSSAVEPVKPVKPIVVWPKENIVAILIGTVVLYLLYRIVVKRKA